MAKRTDATPLTFPEIIGVAQIASGAVVDLFNISPVERAEDVDHFAVDEIISAFAECLKCLLEAKPEWDAEDLQLLGAVERWL